MHTGNGVFKHPWLEDDVGPHSGSSDAGDEGLYFVHEKPSLSIDGRKGAGQMGNLGLGFRGSGSGHQTLAGVSRVDVVSDTANALLPRGPFCPSGSGSGFELWGVVFGRWCLMFGR